jgi:tRNA (Thr-GGU) A37 N-methylase
MAINSIGIINMPFNDSNTFPIQPLVAEGVKGCMKLSPKFIEEVSDWILFSNIILRYRLHIIKKELP